LQKCADKIEKLEDRNDQPDKENNIEANNKSIDSKEENLNIRNNENQTLQVKLTLVA